MKIVLTGGSTGGHFYPLIAVAECIDDIVEEKSLLEPQLLYIGPRPFDIDSLAEHDIQYLPTSAGKRRHYGSLLNVLDLFKTAWGIMRATVRLFSIYPDVIFSTGSYAAFPTLFAARLLRIPVIIYDADASPGRVSRWSAKFAKWIALAHPDAATYFPERLRDRMARVGHPIRKEIERLADEGGHEFLKLDPNVPTICIMGGSQGARAINEVLLDALPTLVEKYNIVHQTGTGNLEEVSGVAKVVLHGSKYEERYRPFGLLNTLAMRMTASISSLVIARAGSGTIFEIAAWSKPSILVPLPIDVSHDQTENAFSYARSGGAVVIEQENLSPHVLVAEIDRIMSDDTLRESMAKAAGAYARPGAARKIADILIETALRHEPT